LEVCAFIIIFSMTAVLFCSQWISELVIVVFAAHRFRHLPFYCHWN